MTDQAEAQNSLEFYKNANGSVSCYDTILPEFFVTIINLRHRSVRFIKDVVKNEEEDHLRQKRTTREPEKQATTHVHVEDIEKLNTRDEILK